MNAANWHAFESPTQIGTPNHPFSRMIRSVLHIRNRISSISEAGNRNRDSSLSRGYTPEPRVPSHWLPGWPENLIAVVVGAYHVIRIPLELGVLWHLPWPMQAPPLVVHHHMIYISWVGDCLRKG